MSDITNVSSESVTSCHLDPEVTKTSIKIAKVVEKAKTVTDNKTIKSVGSQRPEKKLEAEIVDGNDQRIEEDVLTADLISADTMKEVKEIARNNPLTNELIEKGKQFFHDNRELVIKQTQNLVALYNIKDQKPFFFISPSEARMAIDYIKGVRNGLIQDKEDEKAKDKWVHEFLNTVKLSGEKALKNREWKTSTVDSDELRDKILEDLRLDRVKLLYYYGSMTESIMLSLNWINHIFSVMESLDTGVDTLIMNAARFADVRGFGRVVYEEATYREIKDRGIFGRLFTAEIYVSSKIPSNQVITGSSKDKLMICNNNGWEATHWKG
jgi:hypothetical protein